MNCINQMPLPFCIGNKQKTSSQFLTAQQAI